MRARLALFALACATIASAPAAAADPVALFRKLCVGGEARIAAGDIAVVSRGDMPRAVRKTLPAGAGEKIYRINGGAHAFLIVQGEPGAGASRSCSIIAADIVPSQLVTVMLGRPLTGGERGSYDRGGPFHRTTAEGARLSAEVVPPDFVVATVRQGAAAAPVIEAPHGPEH